MQSSAQVAELVYFKLNPDATCQEKVDWQSNNFIPDHKENPDGKSITVRMSGTNQQNIFFVIRSSFFD